MGIMNAAKERMKTNVKSSEPYRSESQRVTSLDRRARRRWIFEPDRRHRRQL
jgi:hypothetical protein